jgi:hypothetical protein
LSEGVLRLRDYITIQASTAPAMPIESRAQIA